MKSFEKFKEQYLVGVSNEKVKEIYEIYKTARFYEWLSANGCDLKEFSIGLYRTIFNAMEQDI